MRHAVHEPRKHDFAWGTRDGESLVAHGSVCGAYSDSVNPPGQKAGHGVPGLGGGAGGGAERDSFRVQGFLLR